MRNLGAHVATVFAGICLPVLEAVFGLLAIPILLLLDKAGVLGSTSPSIMWFFWMVPLLHVGLALGHEGSRSWRWSTLLAVGLIIGAPLFAWIMTDDVQAGIQMEPDWVHDEYLSGLRHMLWNSLAGTATLFTGTWLGGLVARARSAGHQS